jgi:hypothetical protein
VVDKIKAADGILKHCKPAKVFFEFLTAINSPKHKSAWAVWYALPG